MVGIGYPAVMSGRANDPARACVRSRLTEPHNEGEGGKWVLDARRGLAVGLSPRTRVMCGRNGQLPWPPLACDCRRSRPARAGPRPACMLRRGIIPNAARLGFFPRPALPPPAASGNGQSPAHRGWSLRAFCRPGRGSRRRQRRLRRNRPWRIEGAAGVRQLFSALARARRCATNRNESDDADR